MKQYKIVYLLLACILAMFSCTSNKMGNTSAVTTKKSDLPIKSNHTIELEVTEGTSINLDVSPNGKTILFDLLGDIYQMSIMGGEAKQITQGLSWDAKPIWSPDGEKIAFVSDDSGTSNIWIMNKNGLAPRQITNYKFNRSGSTIIACEWFDNDNVIFYPKGNHKKKGYIYNISNKKNNHQIETPLNLKDIFNIRKFSNSEQIYFQGMLKKKPSEEKRQVKLWKYSKVRKDTTLFASINQPEGDGFKSNMVVSSNGKWVAFVELQFMNSASKRKAALKVFNTETNQERVLIPFSFRFLGNERFSFIGNSSNIMISNAGKFYKINVENGNKIEVPFVAKPKIEMSQFTYFNKQVSKNNEYYKNIVSADLSPNGEFLAFSVNRKLYLKNIKEQTIKEIFKENTGQFQPEFSPDGNKIVYVTYNDAKGGDIRVFNLVKNTSEKITKTSGQYQHPTWSPNGKYIGALKTNKTEVSSGGFHAVKGELQLIDYKTNKIEILKNKVPLDYNINFNIAGTHIYYKTAGSEIHTLNIKSKQTQLVSSLLTGLDSRSVSEITSPDGKYVAFVASGCVYLNKLDINNSKKLYIDSLNNKVDVRVTPNGGRNPKWKNKGKTLTWLSANVFHEASIEALFKNNNKDTKKEVIKLKIVKTNYKKVIALTNARIISMKRHEVIENGTIIIEGNRIKDIGTNSDVTIPKNAFIQNCEGKTIIPGLIDMHMHAIPPNHTLKQNWWSYLASLSYGVTTMRDPSNFRNFAYEERIKSGDMTAPRLYGATATGSPFINIANYEDALALVRQYKNMGATFFKTHNSWPRYKRQWMVKAARQENLNITGHYSGENVYGGFNMSILQDGFGGVEHTIWGDYAVYDDVKQLVAKSGIWYTPTFQYSSFSVVDNESEIANDPRVLKFNYFLNEKIQKYLSKVDRKNQLEKKEFLTIMGKDAKDMLKHGAKVSIGSHGNYPGLGMHWAMQILQLGGFTPYEALQSATIVAAEGLGMQKELGSLEVGKLADLIILDKNPLEDLKNTLLINHVMVDGKLYKANSLDMVWPVKKNLPVFRRKE